MTPIAEDPAFLRRLAALLWALARVRSGGGERGLTRPRHGGTHAFLGHRPYAPGDDPREIDWNVLGRMDQVVVKVFGREEEETVDLLLDRTASMAFGEPPKDVAARRLAAALGFLALHSRHRARLGLLGEGTLRFRGPFTGPETAPALFRELDRLPPPAGRDATGALAAYLTRVRRPGAVCAITDGLEAGPLLEQLAHLGERSGEAAVFHLLSPEETSPALGGLCRLEDAEDGAVVELEIGGSLLRAYRRRLEALRSAWERRLERCRVLYRPVSSADALESVVLGWYRARAAA